MFSSARSKRTVPDFQKLLKQTLQGFFDHYHEKLFVAYYPFAAMTRFLLKSIDIPLEVELQRLLGVGRGILLVTGHYGAVEFLPGILALKGYPVSMIVKFQTQQLCRSLKERAAKVGIELIDVSQGQIFLAAVQALRKGRILITECDEFEAWRHDDRKPVSFLGLPLGCDRTLDILQRRSGAPVMVGLIRRAGRRRRYTLSLNVVETQAGLRGDMVGLRCLKVLEEAIYTAPEQWYQWKQFGKMLLASQRPTAGLVKAETAGAPWRRWGRGADSAL